MDLSDRHEIYMRAAMEQARLAASEGETPVGAVIVREGEVISSGRNRREGRQNALGHAELEAINGACGATGSWRLLGCDLYVTLEPCPMCAGAIINARIERVIFGAFDKKAGACGSVINMLGMPFNHRPKILPGVLESECAAILTGFFRELRKE